MIKHLIKYMLCQELYPKNIFNSQNIMYEHNKNINALTSGIRKFSKRMFLRSKENNIAKLEWPSKLLNK